MTSSFDFDSDLDTDTAYQSKSRDKLLNSYALVKKFAGKNQAMPEL